MKIPTFQPSFNSGIQFFILIVRLTLVFSDGNYHVKTTSGCVIGESIHLPDWGNVTRFLGIPYAEPPVGPLRFKRTQALLQNPTTYRDDQVNSALHPAACPQTKHLPEFSHKSLPHGGAQISEDCLKLNIYAPYHPHGRAKFPILIWIPGEGFNYADSVQYDGSALVAKGRVIVVTVNYRVGVFGFMSSGNETLAGNAGLHDILNAIKWIRKNAVNFQGNPDNITLGGRFSGAMAISALIVSPLFREEQNVVSLNAKPLVQQVILHDGVAAGRYVLDHRPLDALEHLANITHCNMQFLDSTIKCLQQLPTEHLLSESMKIPQLWKPVMDDDMITGDPLNEFHAEKYPRELKLLIGDNDGAGSLCYLTHAFQQTSGMSQIKKNTLGEADFRNFIRQSLKEFYPMERENDGLTAIVSHEYMYGRNKETFREQYFRFCGAMYIRYPVEFAARSVAKSSETSVYRYQWSYRPTNSSYPSWLHAAIGEEIVYIFPNSLGKNTDSEEDKAIRNKFMDAYISFVQTGNPSSNESQTVWPKFEIVSKKMMNFTKDGMLGSSTSFLDRDIHFWREAVNPLVESLYQNLMEMADRSRTCFKTALVPERSVLGQALIVIVILIGIIFAVAVTYFFVKNWGNPRNLWRFR
ncbi:unnamed protein product [Allacma fusca]|uniref:Carboxylesterase type B domain-containing protein n=1 Tax=Allacma fusca TaxID=39272 RepID=A0A8J2KAT9_9HEXA|nr:unnamed protein product [Allacma fusca]